MSIELSSLEDGCILYSGFPGRFFRSDGLWSAQLTTGLTLEVSFWCGNADGYGFLVYRYGRALPRWLRLLRICLQCRRPRFDPWVGKIPWRREWLPTPIFLPGEFHGQRSLVCYSLWSCSLQRRTREFSSSYTCFPDCLQEDNVMKSTLLGGEALNGFISLRKFSGSGMTGLKRHILAFLHICSI